MPRIPPGGHHFVEANGMMIRAKSRTEVVAAISAYRAKNSLPLGDPENELKRYYSRIAPYLVRIRGADESNPNGLRQQCSENIHAAWYGRFELAKKINAAHVDICRQCPARANKFDDNDPITVYSEEAEIRASYMIGMLDTTSDGICRHHKMPLSVLNRLADPGPIASPDAPAQCWINKREESTDDKLC